MERTGVGLRRARNRQTSLSSQFGEMGEGGSIARGRGAARAVALAALVLPMACAGLHGPTDAPADASYWEARASIDVGLELYGSGEAVLAAHRFEDASYHARVSDDFDLERIAVAAQCMAWLRARELPRFAACTQRLEDLQRESPHSDPGVNALIALGAVAGDRPLPPLRIPNEILPVVRAAREGSP